MRCASHPFRGCTPSTPTPTPIAGDAWVRLKHSSALPVFSTAPTTLSAARHTSLPLLFRGRAVHITAARLLSPKPASTVDALNQPLTEAQTDKVGWLVGSLHSVSQWSDSGGLCCAAPEKARVCDGRGLRQGAAVKITPPKEYRGARRAGTLLRERVPHKRYSFRCNQPRSRLPTACQRFPARSGRQSAPIRSIWSLTLIYTVRDWRRGASIDEEALVGRRSTAQGWGRRLLSLCRKQRRGAHGALYTAQRLKRPRSSLHIYIITTIFTPWNPDTQLLTPTFESTF